MCKLFRRWSGRQDWAPRTMLLCRTPCCRSWPSDSRGTMALQSLCAQLACRSRLFTDWLPCLAGGTEVSLPSQAPGARGAAPGVVRALMFLDTHVAFWQLALQHSRQYRAHSSAGLPHLGTCRNAAQPAHKCLEAACHPSLPTTCAPDEALWNHV